MSHRRQSFEMEVALNAGMLTSEVYSHPPVLAKRVDVEHFLVRWERSGCILRHIMNAMLYSFLSYSFLLCSSFILTFQFRHP